MTVSHDLTDAVWRTSSRSGGSGQCVQTARPVLCFAPAEWVAFTLSVKAGEFDLL